ncbi:6518_t:CDS:2 [Scutellospora calospora]|uniref:6518_t:CDS:1 n=1 Tax=Scutellospora calospora TaxID=85575 RepID=A0ACA9L8Y7_9GLOM|nr:6518_t:CDS:2 [Scutellospora calospora]
MSDFLNPRNKERYFPYLKDKKEKCFSCLKDKKGCNYNGMPGEFLCERCVNKKECWFLCEGCQKNFNEKGPPEKYNIVTDLDDQKLYLQVQKSKCYHRIEITSTFLDEMARSYLTFSNTLNISGVFLASTPTLPVSSTLSPQLYAPNAFVMLSLNTAQNNILSYYDPVPPQCCDLTLFQQNEFSHTIDGYDYQSAWYQSQVSSTCSSSANYNPNLL